MSEKQEVVKGATFIFVEMAISIVSGYVFWIIMSRITTTEIIGIASVMISFGTIFSTVCGMGANIGVQRFLGRSFSEKKFSNVNVFVKGSFIITTIGLFGGIVFIVAGYDWLNTLFDMQIDLTIVAVVFIISATIATLFRFIIIASLNTKVLPSIMMLSTFARIILGTVLVLLGAGALGVLLGFTIFPLITAFILSFVVLHLLLKNSGTLSKPDISLMKSIKLIMEASTPSWIPYSIYTIGIYLGPIVVFGSYGASQAGIFSMAFFIAVAISAASSALFSIAYPKLSAMDDGRKRFAWRSIQMSLILSIPISTSFVFYSTEIMGLLGSSYTAGSLSLQILLITMLGIIVTAGVNTLAYSYGNYRQVLLLGMAANVPRVILYFLLVPIYEKEGAAIDYSIGSITGFVVSIILAGKMGMRIDWKSVAIIFFLPLTVSFVFTLVGINYILGISATLVLSYVLLLRLNIMKKDDLADVMLALPSNYSVRLTKLWSATHKVLGRKD